MFRLFLLRCHFCSRPFPLTRRSSCVFVFAMFRSCSGKQTVQAVVLLLLLSPWVFGGGGTSFGQGAERVRLKALPTLSRTVRASVTSALPGGEARVSLITDEWLAVPLKGGEDKSPKNGPTGSTAPPGKWSRRGPCGPPDSMFKVQDSTCTHVVQ